MRNFLPNISCAQFDFKLLFHASFREKQKMRQNLQGLLGEIAFCNILMFETLWDVVIALPVTLMAEWNNILFKSNFRTVTE